MIGIDGSRLNVGERTGTETYTYQLLAALARLGVDDQIRVYLNAASPPDDLPAVGEPVCLPFPRLWTHVRLSWEMHCHPPGVLFVPAHVVPLRHPPSVVTIHDVGYLHFPESHPATARRMLHATTRWSTRTAQQVIAISEATRRDLVGHYAVPEERIQVIYHGVDHLMRPASPNSVADLKHRLGLPDAYVLFVGTIQPRKNLGRLAEAMSAIMDAELPHRLVIAGRRGWLASEVETQIAQSRIAERVQFLGYVAAADLPALYSGAGAFCFPSLYEGFGLPVLEAMACGVPVVAANTSAIPEVAGDAALLVEPIDPAAIGSALRRVLTDVALRRELIARGQERAKRFTWERSAQATIDLLRSVGDRQR